MAHGACHRGNLVCVVRVRRIAAALQSRGEGVYVATRIERGGVAGVVAQQRDIILKTLRWSGIGLEPCRGARRDAVLEFLRAAVHRGTGPSGGSLDSEEIIAGAAGRDLRQILAPVGFQRGLGDEMAWIDAEQR